MRIIRSGDRYAVAKGRWIFTLLLDLRVPTFWWPYASSYADDCWGDMKDVDRMLRLMKPKKWVTVRKISPKDLPGQD